MANNTLLGRIVLSRKGFFTVENGDGLCICKAATRLRNDKEEPLCGDFAEYEPNGDGTGFITALAPRKNRFVRPNISNVDIFVIVIASAEPQPDLFYVDKMTCIGEKNNVQTVIAITKNDIKNSSEIANVYRKCGYKVFATRSDTHEGVDELKQYLSNKLAVFAGPSGVGKSSLLNAMFPLYNTEVGELSKRISRGKNTTRHTELFRTGKHGYIADTPGFTSLDFERYDLLKFEELKDVFPEMRDYTNRCLYRNCGHTKEEGCAVIEDVKNGIIPESRHNSYVKLFELLKKKKIY